MMAGLVLTLSLLFASANMAASLTVTTTTDTVTVRRGERLQLSCVIETGPGEIVSEVKWYRGMDVNAYASLSIPSNCALFPEYLCAEGRTVDNRGRVIYQKNTTVVATLTLIFASGNLTDSTIFSCGAVLAAGSQEPKRSKSIRVTVCNFPGKNYPVCTLSWPFQGSTFQAAVICEAEITDPVVSLEWTTVVNSSRISLSNNTVIVGDEVKNTLDLNTVDSAYYSFIFTCYMRSEACPVIENSCFVLVESANPASPLPDETNASVSGHLDQSVSTIQSNITECCNDDPGTSSPSPTPTSTKHPVSSNVNIVLIAAITGASSFALLILIVAVCLLSRRKAKRRRNGAASRDINFHVYANTVPGTKTSRCPANVYDEDHRGDREGRSDTVPTGDNRLTGPVQPPAAYTSVPVVGLQDPPAPVYDVLDPDMASSRETSGDF